MRKIVNRYLAAAGSVMDIMPTTDYWQYAASGSDCRAIRSDVKVIASDMNRVIRYEFKTPQAGGRSQKASGKQRVAKSRS